MQGKTGNSNNKIHSIEKAKSIIESDILNGVFYPHQRLIEAEIASKLGMSRTPVREALKQLEVTGLVTRLPTRGLIVTPISTDDIRNKFEVREALETMAIKLVYERITPEALARLKMYLDNFQKVVNQSLQENNPFIDPHWSVLFHAELYSACNNLKLINYIEDLRDIERLAYVSKYFTESDYSLFYTQHNSILESIEQRDREGAIKAVITHLDTMRDIYLKYL